MRTALLVAVVLEAGLHKRLWQNVCRSSSLQEVTVGVGDGVCAVGVHSVSEGEAEVLLTVRNIGTIPYADELRGGVSPFSFDFA